MPPMPYGKGGIAVHVRPSQLKLLYCTFLAFQTTGLAVIGGAELKSF